jgi:hypothetical protein
MEFPSHIDEFDELGIEKAPSEVVTPPRVAGAPITFECRLERIIPIGEVGDHVVFGIVERIHIRDDLYLERGRIDTAALNPVGRLAAEYTLVDNVFTTPLDEETLTRYEGWRMQRLDDKPTDYSAVGDAGWSPSGSTTG